MLVLKCVRRIQVITYEEAKKFKRLKSMGAEVCGISVLHSTKPTNLNEKPAPRRGAISSYSHVMKKTAGLPYLEQTDTEFRSGCEY